MSQAIPLTQIREDAELQPRVKMDPVAVNEYAEAMKRGDHFPAVVVFDVPKEGLLLVDGYHRLHAARSASKETLDAEIIPGERREAILYSLKVNDTHGIRRTNSDKRRAVERLLSDPEWMNWNNQKIAEACRVTGEFVRKLRSHPSCNNCKIPTERTVERNGKTYTMDTSNIGKRTVQDVPGPIQVISDEPRTTPISVQEANNLMFDAAPKQPTEPAEKPGQPVLLPGLGERQPSPSKKKSGVRKHLSKLSMMKIDRC